MIKRTIFAACVAAFGFGTLPAAAAAEPVTDHPGDPFLEGVTEGTKFTASGGEAKLTTPIGTYKCKHNFASGQFEDPETGSISILFEECTSPLGTKCTTIGWPAGAIQTTTLPFHLKTVKHEGAESPGVLITPGSNSAHGPHIATFECGFIGNFAVGGNGLVGTIAAPLEDQKSNKATVRFGSAEAESTTQTHREVTNGIEQYDLKNKFNSSETNTVSLDAEGTVSFGLGMEPILKTTPLK